MQARPNKQISSVIATLANLNVTTAYIDGELCGIKDAGLPSFAQTQAAADGERGVRLVEVLLPFFGSPRRDPMHGARWR